MSEEQIVEKKETLKARRRKVIVLVCICLIAAVFIAHYVLKGTCAGGEPETARDYFILSFLPQLGNSGIVFTLLWYFGWPLAEKMALDRKTSLERDISESARLKEAAETSEAESRRRLQEFEGESKLIQESYRLSAAQECARIEEEAEKASARLEHDAEVSFALQTECARRNFEKEVIVSAVEQARKDIAMRLSSDEHLRNKLIEDSINSLEF